MSGADVEPLYMLTKSEWRDIVRKIRPDWTEEQFQEAWKGFLLLKHRKVLN